MIEYADFQKIEIRVGVIVDAEDFPEAKKPAYKLKIDFGNAIGIKSSSAQITENYSLNDLKGRKVLAVVNFPEKQIGPFKSQVLTLGTEDTAGHVILADPGENSEVGSILY
ncbi:tRNA-binding protein [Candidatus Saccharibacteria bacterium]|nr:tRNA-binding protein [Candidatus Saccharibacteria bacterium]